MSTRVTIKDIARMANVSTATVSNVLNSTGRVSNETVRKVHSVMEEHRFSPSRSARNLKNKKSQLIAVVVPFLEKGKLHDNPFYWELVTGIEEGARNERFHVLLIGVNEGETFSFVHERHVDGLIAVGVFEDTDVFRRIQALNLPTVFMDSYISSEQVFQVNLDDELAGYIGAKHLLGLGHRHVCLLAGTLQERGVNYERWKGYRRALCESGLEDFITVHEVPVSMQGGHRAAQMFIKDQDRATAVFTVSDALAMGFIKGLQELGFSVPEDVSVVGFDDTFYADYMVPSLTTVRQDILSKGQVAVQLLLRQIQQTGLDTTRKVVLPPELKVRNSTRSITI